jgi:hypothetical protein
MLCFTVVTVCVLVRFFCVKLLNVVCTSVICYVLMR